MDVTLNWRVSDDVAGLVKTLSTAKAQLVALAEEMWDISVFESTTVYAHAKVVELLRLSDEWVDASDDIEEFSYENRRERQFTASRIVAKFKEFELQEHEILSHDTVRLVTQVNAGRALYANVKLVTK